MSVLATLTANVPKTGRRKPDLQRILELPEYDPNGELPDLTAYVRRPGGTMSLRNVQNRALYYSLLFGGLLGFIGVGRGKTLICVLLAELLRQQKGIHPSEVVLLIPPDMRRDLSKEWHKYGQHFRLAHGINILTYAQLSRPESTAILEGLRPRAIICDEADKLRDPKTATTKRFLRYMKKHSIHFGGDCSLYVMSGTMGKRSIKDWAHLAKYALGTSAPVPLEYGSLETFALALDVRRTRKNLSACGFEEDDTGRDSPYVRACAVVGRLRDRFGGDTLRDGFQRRLASAPGTVISSDDGIDSEAIITPLKLEMPDSVSDLYVLLDNEWQLPDGTLTEDPLELNRKQREISLGFWYQWVWPDDKPDIAWIEARQDWGKALRRHLPYSSTGTDSPALVERLCIAWAWHRHKPSQYPQPAYEVPQECEDTYRIWAGQKHKPVPPTRAVWVDYFAVYAACEWAARQPSPALIWYEQEDFGHAVAKASGYRFVGPGVESNAWLAEAKQGETIVISRNAHFRGKNLQDRWYRSYVSCPVSNGGIAEQHYGRTYRSGQPSKHVYFDVCVQTPVLKDALKFAREDARFIEDTHGTRQILNHATFKRTVKVPLSSGSFTTSRLQALPKHWGRVGNVYAPVPTGYRRHPADDKILALTNRPI